MVVENDSVDSIFLAYGVGPIYKINTEMKMKFAQDNMSLIWKFMHDNAHLSTLFV